MQSRPQLPPAALTWLLGERPCRVLAAASGPAMLRLASQAGHELHVVDQDHGLADRLVQEERFNVCVARAEVLPYQPQSFDAMLLHQVFHRFTPQLMLAEMARVLDPTGWVAASYMVRDDSVPWVRRLVDLMRSADPTAMGGNFGDSSIEALLTSKYFPVHTARDFRVWVPIDRRGLVEMVAAQPAVQSLNDLRRARLIADSVAIYDIAASGSELRLPYQLKCWKAYVDQGELTTPIQLTDDALTISL